MIEKLIIDYNQEINSYIEIAKNAIKTEQERVVYESACIAYKQCLDASNGLTKKHIFNFFDIDYDKIRK